MSRRANAFRPIVTRTRKAYVVGLILAAATMGTLLLGGVAHAANINVTNRLVDPSQVFNHFLNGPTLGNVGYLVVGSGAFNTNDLAFTVESPTSSITLSIINADICNQGTYNGVDQPDSAISPVTTFYTVTNAGIGTGLVTGRQCPSQTRSIVLNNLRKLDDGNWGGFVYVRLTQAGGGSQQNSFQVVASNANARVGYSSKVIDAYSDITGNDFDINLANTDMQFGELTDYQIPFSLECNATLAESTGSIEFYDMDDTSAGGNLQGPGSVENSPSVRFHLLQIDKGDNNILDLQTVVFQTIAGPGSGDKGTFTINIPTLSKDKQYYAWLEDVSRPNAIQFSIKSMKINTTHIDQDCDSLAPKPFKVTPVGTAKSVPAGEDEVPTQVIFAGSINFASNNYDVTTRVTRLFSKNGVTIPGATAPPFDATGNDANPYDLSDVTVNVTNPQPGDKYCTVVTASPSSGTVSQGGQTPTTNQPPTAFSAPACVTIVERPYLKAYNGDVLAGSGFEDDTGNCTVNATAQISGFAKGPDSIKNYYRGASSQLGAMALGAISGFYSAGLRANDPQPPKGLTFANTIAADAWGGHFDATICATDFFAANTRRGTEEDHSTDPNPIDLSTLLDSGHRFYDGSVTRQIAGMTGYDANAAVYIDGDVWIKGNIIYTPNYTYTLSNNQLKIPHLFIIARGNIYIDPGVTQLDGVLIAEPDPGQAGTGVIYTCAPGGVAQTAANWGPSCQNKLTINGGLIANHINWGRLNGTVNRAPAGETAGSTNIAEVVNGTADAFVGNLPFASSQDTLVSSGYDYIVSLPPVF